MVDLIDISPRYHPPGDSILKLTCSPSLLTVGGSQRTDMPGLPDDNAIRLAIEEVAKKPGTSVLRPAKLELGIDPGLMSAGFSSIMNQIQDNLLSLGSS
jgi:hypothetical protein